MRVVLEVASFVLLVFFILLIARLVFDYVMMFARSWRPSGVAAAGLEVVYSVTDAQQLFDRRGPQGHGVSDALSRVR